MCSSAESFQTDFAPFIHGQRWKTFKFRRTFRETVRFLSGSARVTFYNKRMPGVAVVGGRFALHGAIYVVIAIKAWLCVVR